MTLGIATFFIKALLLSFSNLSNSSQLAVLREAFGFFNLLILSSHINNATFEPVKVVSILKKFIVLLSGLIFLQFFIMKFFGSYFGFPLNWFAINAGPLSFMLRTNAFRPVAFYGEPSYAGFIIISVLMIYLKNNVAQKMKPALGFSIFCFTTSVFLQSIATIISVVILFLFWILFYRGGIGVATRTVVIASTSLIAAIIFFLNPNVIERFANISASADPSTTSRIFDPLTIIKEMLVSGDWFFGVTNFPENIDNAALNLFIR